MFVFVSGKYTDRTPELVQKNIEKAEETAKYLLSLGLTPFCPHTMCQGWERDARLEYGDFMRLDLEILSKADCIFLLDNWTTSEGSKKERQEAIKLGIPVFESMKELMTFCLRSTPVENKTSKDVLGEQISEEKKQQVNANNDIKEMLKQTILGYDFEEKELDEILKQYQCNLILDIAMGFRGLNDLNLKPQIQASNQFNRDKEVEDFIKELWKILLQGKEG